MRLYEEVERAEDDIAAGRVTDAASSNAALRRRYGL